ncbi:HEAT repeat domain-containing protein [Nevskia soli]|uniref:HEAT repeat domain-containing protein n=1 Tax=Nevskia soli TaxID=418856 RepID=UPI0004A6CD9E|nr:HEAT repeat domain-containing protein [Nevskia soli]
MDSYGEPLKRFVEHASTYDGSLDQFWSLKDEFGIFASSGFPALWVNGHLAEMLRKPADAGLWFWPQFDIQQINGLTIAVRVIGDQQPFQSSSEAAMYVPIGPQSLHCDLYHLPPHANDVFDPKLRLEPAGRVTARPGEILLAEPDMVYDFQAGAGDSPVVAVVLTTPFALRLKWIFDRNTMKALWATDADVIDMQLRAASDVLGNLRDPSSLEVLEWLSTHRHHAVRWSAIQNVARIKASSARPLLKRALDDPHPLVQAAAAKTLQKLDADS